MNLQLLKSKYDEKEYRLITLENGLQAILVSDVKNLVELPERMSTSESDDGSDMDVNGVNEDDGNDDDDEDVDDDEDDAIDGESDGDEDNDEKKTKLAACSMCVAAGSFYDPPNAQGLAHFLEHMLFMGCEKFPEVNYWDAFIQKCGGYSNAVTADEYTMFHFECRDRFLGPIMHRFSQSFISPLLSKSSMAQERNIVNSEFEMSMTDDDTRLAQVLGSLASDGHPARTFAWGNNHSLENQISDDELLHALRNFWLRYYSADHMKLAIVSRLSLDTLEKYVRDNFSAVPKSKLPRLDLSQYRNATFGPKFNSMVLTKPLSQSLEVCLSWVLPPLHDVYEADPLLYINFFLAHEGKGSIANYLKEKIWATSLISGQNETEMRANTLFSMFSINIRLTNEGLQNLDKVIEVVFGYLALLRKTLPDQQIFDELKTIHLAEFRHKCDIEPEYLAQGLSYSVHARKPEHFLSAGEFCHEYRPEIISSVIQHFGLDNFNIALKNSQNRDEIYDQEEFWFKTKYKISPFREDQKKAWANAEPFPFCHLPLPNQYITKEFDILPCDKGTRYPEKIMETPLLELWFRQDTKFKRPIASFALHLIPPYVLSLKRKVQMDLFVKFLSMKLKGSYYDASIANCNWSLGMSDLGLHVKFYGYNEKLAVLLTKLIADIKNELDDISNPNNELFFNAVKEDMEKSYDNSLKDIDSFALGLRLACLEETYWMDWEKLLEVSKSTFSDFCVVCKEFFSNFHAQILIQGNIIPETALQIGAEFSAGFDSPKNSIPKRRVWKLEPGQEKYLRVRSINPENNQGTVINYYQYGPMEIRAACIIDFLMYHMSEPLFDSLRTKQQLGYEVDCMSTNTFEVLGFAVNVCHQHKFPADDVNNRIEIFLKEFATNLRNLSATKFKKSIETFCALKNVEDNSLAEEVSRNYAEIVAKKYFFNSLEVELATLNTLSLDEVCELFENLALNKVTRKKLGIQVLPAPDSAMANSGGESKKIATSEENVELTIDCPDTNFFISSFEEMRQNRQFYGTSS